jgi:hypothetical protein
MSNADPTGFGKFVPGFDFLQSLAQGAAGNNATMPNFGKWVAPTLDVEELDKRIEELKIVRFWLEQNSNALGATIQALEVQKMTLATLKGMNFSFGEAAASAMPQASASSAASAAAAAKESANEAAKAAKDAAAKSSAAEEGSPKPTMIDPMQMWGSLTQQFQKIAESAVKEASGVAAQATKAAAAATSAHKATTSSAPKPRAAARKPVRKTSATGKATKGK